ncbi:MAG: exo-alpha-sialidase, partial [candidate division Zixibacteria bacterium]|nr:exo-alpha-sialidase [candidate division Zixibacteria bacterium]
MTHRYFSAISLVAITIFAASCAQKTSTGEIAGITPITTPALAPSGEPNISSSPGKAVLLSWVEEDTTNNTQTLRFSQWENGSWSEARTIARGSDWFVNWADFPAVAVQDDGRLFASWLVKSAASTYAYDVTLAYSNDGGKLWSEPFSPHNDKTPTEHGFVSMQPLSNGTFAVSWLDGREMVEDGPMTLRFATISATGKVSNQALLDKKVCDCCQTSMTIAGDGSILVAYRDRTDEEIRDMSIVRYSDSAWSSPAPISSDNWNIAGCPVNGPALSASNSMVAASWFTMGNDSKARVLCAFSKDFGKSFDTPIR